MPFIALMLTFFGLLKPIKCSGCHADLPESNVTRGIRKTRTRTRARTPVFCVECNSTNEAIKQQEAVRKQQKAQEEAQKEYKYLFKKGCGYLEILRETGIMWGILTVDHLCYYFRDADTFATILCMLDPRFDLETITHEHPDLVVEITNYIEEVSGVLSYLTYYLPSDPDYRERINVLLPKINKEQFDAYKKLFAFVVDDLALNPHNPSTKHIRGDCGVCFNDDVVLVQLPSCVHAFCASCINSWLDVGGKTCPMCRASVC